MRVEEQEIRDVHEPAAIRPAFPEECEPVVAVVSRRSFRELLDHFTHSVMDWLDEHGVGTKV